MRSKKFILRCIDCDREIIIEQSRQMLENGTVDKDGIAVTFKGNESGIYCECGNYIEVW